VIFALAHERSLVSGVHEASLPEHVGGVARGFTLGRL
jgi:hypothetical protein